jgi:hypothetical protein
MPVIPIVITVFLLLGVCLYLALTDHIKDCKSTADKRNALIKIVQSVFIEKEIVEFLTDELKVLDDGDIEDLFECTATLILSYENNRANIKRKHIQDVFKEMLK